MGCEAYMGKKKDNAEFDSENFKRKETWDT
jgi:hypothetical protein